MSPFAAGTIGGAVVVVGLARALRGRFYAVFSAVLLTVHGLAACALFPHVGALAPAFVALHATLYINLLSLVWARPRPLAFRLLVSWPSAVFAAGTFVALPWAVAVTAGAAPRLLWLPYVVAALGFVDTWCPRRSVVRVAIDGRDAGGLARARPSRAELERPLRLAQLTDTHLGPFQSPARLRRIVERLVASRPDLALLTGDFLTMETHASEAELAYALAPLRALPGRAFACRGNHDLEAPRTVAGALAAAGVRLLIDEAEVVETPAGRVQIVGLDYHLRDRAARIARALEAFPREPGALRLVLLHHPGSFSLVPDGDADLVLSGHTHGGHVGLVSLGLPLTVLGLLSRIPDHGLWARGKNRLYVHRGTGHYGFPIRLGVPAEESVLEVEWCA
ncbi:MAG: metallophosphoesterase [Polyangiaceae bacterium]|nr:metallophosphoesterase [Polyangiaceae bacterium]